MIYIGIDPDIKKSGVAFADNGKIISLETLDFWSLIDRLKSAEGASIIIEAGWLNKTHNYHATENKFTAARIGSNVGANWQVGKLLEEYCQYANRTYQLVRPKKSKVDAKQFSIYAGWDKRTNSEQRDAGMLVIGRIN